MPHATLDPLGYYTQHSPITDPGDEARLLEGLPADFAALCRIPQGLLVHFAAVRQYGFEPPEDRAPERDLRHVSRLLRRIQELDPAPLAAPRPLEKRLLVCCRDYAVLLCAILRHKGVPARPRCGFAGYFSGPSLPSGFWVDHWVCEVWSAGQRRWLMVDAELDEATRRRFSIAFDPLDVPHDGFLLAGEAWALCRTGQADPDSFGLDPQDEHGRWYVQSQLVRDLAALNKRELLSWDCWGLGNCSPGYEPGDQELALLDRIAALTSPQAVDASFAELRSLYEADDRLRVPPVITSYTYAGVRELEWAKV